MAMAQEDGSSESLLPSLTSLSGPNHLSKPSLSVLISQTPSPAPGDPNIDLPSAPPLSHDLFAGDSFDPSDFLLERRHTGLEDLRSELRAYLGSLRQSLIEVINEEYEAFIGLSLGLRQASVSTSLATIRRPVLSIRAAVTGVKGELEIMKEEMDSVLSERKRVREVKAVLKRLLEMEDQVEKVEGLLKLGEASAAGREVDRITDSPAKRLERIAAEYSQMLYLVAKAGDLPFVHSLDARITRITTTLQLDLSQLLTSVLTTPSSNPTRRDALTALFRTYASLNLYSTAEEIVRKTIVHPFIVKTIQRDSLSSPSYSSSSTTSSTSEDSSIPKFYQTSPIQLPNKTKGVETQPLVDLYNTLLAFVSKECGMILDVAERSSLGGPTATTATGALVGGAGTEVANGTSNGADEKKQPQRTGYEILTGVVWDEICKRLMNELGHVIFAAGRPAVFQQNYLATTLFLATLSSLCPTPSHLNHFQNSQSYTTFIKRFQLPVYFQMRFKEIVSGIERTLDGPTSSTGGETFVMIETETVWRGIGTCWSESVYLGELGGRFWKLTLQLISRYRTWQANAAPKFMMSVASPAPPPSAAALASLSPGSNVSSRSSFDGARWTPSTNSSRPGTPAMDDAPPEELTLKMLTILIADARLFEKTIWTFWEQRIKECLPPDEELRAQAGEVLKESLAHITSLLPTLSTQIITILTRRCAEHLKHVRAVASQVRASTRKQNPNEPSFFVPNILKELRGYVGGVGKVVEEDLRIKWAEAVVEEIAGRYASIVSSQKRTEDSLRWFKKGRQGLSFFGRGGSTTPAPEEGATDDDKVKLQMQLDIDQLGREALTVGVDVSKMAAWESLRNATEDQGKEAEK